MLILAVDDETLMLNMLVETLKNVFSDERYVVMGFDDGKEALEYVSSSEESLPYAFLDIRLRGMLGIELAKEIKEIRSETRIIFCSAYTEYALDAFSVHAVGYLLKPITKAKIQETLDQIDMMLNRDPEPERQKLVVQTFGHFEAFFNDKPLPWERAKAKELLAFLVDQRGASATNAEIALTLWEDDSKVRSVQTIISSLRKTLRRVGMGDVLVRARNRTSINVKKIKCDLYDYLAGDSLAINVYQGGIYEQLQLGRVYQCFALCGDLSEGRSLR